MDATGFAWVRGCLNAGEAASLAEALGPCEGAGRRGLLAHPDVASLASAPRILRHIQPILGHRPLPVRAIYFDKSPDRNWLVTWHQDVSVAVCGRIELPGYGPWSEKDGIPHVQPPVQVLEQMVTLRIHLDPADGRNGALRVIPGSHVLGRLCADRIHHLRTTVPEHLCVASVGDALLMRPLLLHSSSRSTERRRRRILHIEYAGCSLPPPLAWHGTA